MACHWWNMHTKPLQFNEQTMAKEKAKFLNLFLYKKPIRILDTAHWIEPHFQFLYWRKDHCFGFHLTKQNACVLWYIYSIYCASFLSFFCLLSLFLVIHLLAFSPCPLSSCLCPTEPKPGVRKKESIKKKRTPCRVCCWSAWSNWIDEM